ncbi:1-acyl-sn-glycerol-3-phosphate acyltransferase [Kineosphaera limosa]|uniref:Putative acyltransferase n=1 Tax=Kineosphaera limosa NBRC 100340 TaxID=1184609 RepID=K6WW15_9MICO|nr:lysophospholipid acyltransferase family protein [Kineosphaera limosa]NYD99486.1 1-acyl-sn-glycerol-3-phosphate acyltransferase [Kineosphaera limosa]GAB98021.1 putative acyltransferase [Kineosphaera limosa NBRC 100340]
MVGRSGAWAAYPGRPPLSLAYRNAVRTVRPVVRALTRQDWQGMQHLPREGGCVVAANHISHADPFAVAHFLLDNGHPPFFLGKASLFELPVLGRWLGACEQIPVHRGSGRAADAYRDAVAAVRAGRCVVIMPESTITKDPQGWPMLGKTGAARLALEVGAPVLPLAQWGARELLDVDGTFRPWRRPVMHMLLGPPVPLDDLRDQPVSAVALRAATARIMAAITAGVAQLRHEEAPTDVWDQTSGRRVPVPEQRMNG